MQPYRQHSHTLMCAALCIHSPRRRTASVNSSNAREPISRQLQNGRKLQTRIYELDEPSPQGPQRWRREKPGETNATTSRSNENEFAGHTRTDENLSNHNHSLLPNLRRYWIRSNLSSRLRTFRLPVRLEPLSILLVSRLLFHNQYSPVANFRSLRSLLNDTDFRRRHNKMTKPSQKTHGRRKLAVRLPSGERTFHFEPRASAPAQCARCGKELHGVPTTRVKSFARSSRAPSRQYGGVLCPNCLASEIRALVRSGTAS